MNKEIFDLNEKYLILTKENEQNKIDLNIQSESINEIVDKNNTLNHKIQE